MLQLECRLQCAGWVKKAEEGGYGTSRKTSDQKGRVGGEENEAWVGPCTE